MDVKWVNAPGFEDTYQVSNNGEFRNIKTGRILNPKPKKTGYIVLRLRHKDKTKYVLLHRLIAKAFPEICGEYFEGAQVDHKNRIRTDNRAINLHWVTPRENSNNPLTLKHFSETRKGIPKSEEFKKQVSKTLTNNTYNKKWVIKLSMNDEILHFYPSANEAARQNNLWQSSISYCCQGKLKSAGGFKWKYTL